MRILTLLGILCMSISVFSQKPVRPYSNKKSEEYKNPGGYSYPNYILSDEKYLYGYSTRLDEFGGDAGKSNKVYLDKRSLSLKPKIDAEINLSDLNSKYAFESVIEFDGNMYILASVHEEDKRLSLYAHHIDLSNLEVSSEAILIHSTPEIKFLAIKKKSYADYFNKRKRSHFRIEKSRNGKQAVAIITSKIKTTEGKYQTYFISFDHNLKCNWGNYLNTSLSKWSPSIKDVCIDNKGDVFTTIHMRDNKVRMNIVGIPLGSDEMKEGSGDYVYKVNAKGQSNGHYLLKGSYDHRDSKLFVNDSRVFAMAFGTKGKKEQEKESIHFVEFNPSSMAVINQKESIAQKDWFANKWEQNASANSFNRYKKDEKREDKGKKTKPQYGVLNSIFQLTDIVEFSDGSFTIIGANERDLEGYITTISLNGGGSSTSRVVDYDGGDIVAFKMNSQGEITKGYKIPRNTSTQLKGAHSFTTTMYEDRLYFFHNDAAINTRFARKEKYESYSQKLKGEEKILMMVMIDQDGTVTRKKVMNYEEWKTRGAIFNRTSMVDNNRIIFPHRSKGKKYFCNNISLNSIPKPESTTASIGEDN